MAVPLVAATAQARDFAKTLTLSGAGRVVVELRSGSVQVSGWDKNEVKVEAKGDDEVPKIRAEPDRVVVEGADEDVVVHMPAAAKLRIKTLSGNVTFEGVSGGARAASVSGDFHVKACGGGVELAGVSGGAKVRDVKGGLRFKSVSGGLEAEGVTGDEVQGKTVSGEILLRRFQAKRIELKSHSGNVVAEGILAKEGTLRAKSFSGNLEIRLPVDAAFDIQAQSRMGHVVVGYEVRDATGKHSASRVMGRVRGGGSELQLRSFTGEIRVQPSK
jgi:DUF4097 and DUF4098 domain-containing protein YvlB